MELKRNISDSVFCNLFRDPKYQLDLFMSLHPEIPDVTVDDISYSTLTPILLNQEYNDLSIIVRDKFLVFLEAQSTWSWNILPRTLMYVGQTYKEYINEKKLDMYHTKQMPLPKPELYVVFTGERKDVPETISFSEAFFHGEPTSIEVKATVIHDPNGEGIICEYIYFAKVLQEQKKIYGPTRKAIEETIRICQEKGKLRDYLESRKKEVVTIMEELFSFETSMERIISSREDEAKQSEKERTVMALLRNNVAMPIIVNATELSEDRIKEIAVRNGLIQA